MLDGRGKRADLAMNLNRCSVKNAGSPLGPTIYIEREGEIPIAHASFYHPVEIIVNWIHTLRP